MHGPIPWKRLLGWCLNRTTYSFWYYLRDSLDGQTRCTADTLLYATDEFRTSILVLILDELIFITTSFYIIDNAYLQLAEVMPRACNLFKRKHALNETCEIFTLESTTVYTNLCKVFLFRLSVIISLRQVWWRWLSSSKFSGDGTGARINYSGKAGMARCFLWI